MTSKHFPGKTYELTQENFNKVLRELESLDRQLEMKQDDWLEVCREYDDLKQKLKIAESALNKFTQINANEIKDKWIDLKLGVDLLHRNYLISLEGVASEALKQIKDGE